MEFLDIGAKPAQSHTPPKYGASLTPLASDLADLLIAPGLAQREARYRVIMIIMMRLMRLTMAGLVAVN